MDILTLARQMGIETCLEFDVALLVPEQRIRDLCSENKCGNYRSHYMCPPYVGSLEESSNRLKRFQKGILFQYMKRLDVRNDYGGLKQSKRDFRHRSTYRRTGYKGYQ